MRVLTFVTNHCNPNVRCFMRPLPFICFKQHVDTAVDTSRLSVNGTPHTTVRTLSSTYLENKAFSLGLVLDKTCSMEWGSSWSWVYLNRYIFCAKRFSYVHRKDLDLGRQTGSVCYVDNLASKFEHWFISLFGPVFS